MYCLTGFLRGFPGHWTSGISGYNTQKHAKKFYTAECKIYENFAHEKYFDRLTGIVP